jgi:hypothetical protein
MENEPIWHPAPVESGTPSPGAATQRGIIGCTGIAFQWTLRGMHCQPQRLCQYSQLLQSLVRFTCSHQLAKIKYAAKLPAHLNVS